MDCTATLGALREARKTVVKARATRNTRAETGCGGKEVLERSGSVSDLAAGQVGIVVQDGDVVDGEVHCLRRHRYRLAHVFKQASAKEGKR